MGADRLRSRNIAMLRVINYFDSMPAWTACSDSLSDHYVLRMGSNCHRDYAVAEAHKAKRSLIDKKDIHDILIAANKVRPEFEGGNPGR